MKPWREIESREAVNLQLVSVEPGVELAQRPGVASARFGSVSRRERGQELARCRGQFVRTSTASCRNEGHEAAVMQPLQVTAEQVSVVDLNPPGNADSSRAHEKPPEVRRRQLSQGQLSSIEPAMKDVDEQPHASMRACLQEALCERRKLERRLHRRIR